MSQSALESKLKSKSLSTQLFPSQTKVFLLWLLSVYSVYDSNLTASFFFFFSYLNIYLLTYALHKAGVFWCMNCLLSYSELTRIQSSLNQPLLISNKGSSISYSCSSINLNTNEQPRTLMNIQQV